MINSFNSAIIFIVFTVLSWLQIPNRGRQPMERRGGAVISSGRMDFFCVCVCICIFYFYLYFDLDRFSFYLYSYISIELVFLIALHSVFVLVSMLIEIFLFHICVLQGECGFKIRVLQRARRTDNGVEGGCGEKRKIISNFSLMIPNFPPFDVCSPFLLSEEEGGKRYGCSDWFIQLWGGRLWC